MNPFIVFLGAALTCGSACAHAPQPHVASPLETRPAAARLLPTSATPTAASANLDVAMPRLIEAINAERSKRGAAPLRIDRGLALVAQVSAAEYRRLGRGFEQRVAAWAHDEMRGFSIVFGRVVAVVVFVEKLDQAEALLEPAMDPEMQWVGLDVATAPPPTGPRGGYSIVLTLGR